MKIKKWQFISRKDVLSHPRMNLVEDIVELPNGNQTEYLRLSPTKNHSIAIIALNDNNEILLQKEYSYPVDQIMWQLPGGGMHSGETIEMSANRELSEESGYRARDIQTIGYFYTNNRRSDEKQYVVLCSNLYKEQAESDPEEFIENHWVTVKELLSMITNGDINNINLLAAINLYINK